MRHVCHLSSVHPTKDVRIFHKECASLAAAGYRVTLVVPGVGDHRDKGVDILTVPRASSRRERLLRTSRLVLTRALEADAELYHFHDPELFPVALALKAKGKKVVFDSHEDLPRQILSKPWIPSLLRRPLSGLTERIEDFAAKRIDAVVTATPFIRERFAALGVRAEDINNYPMLEELDLGPVDWANKARQAIYVGGITAIRGAREMVQAIAQTDAKLLLAGPIEGALQADLDQAAERSQVELAGFLGRPQVVEALRQSMVGLCVLYPTVNYLDSTPIKLFEYMAAGLPVIASDFPRWRELVGDSGAAIFVDPQDPQAIAEAIESLVNDPQKAQSMGEAGRQRVLSGFHWGVELEKLLALYESLLA
jgi:hypothetical protein